MPSKFLEGGVITVRLQSVARHQGISVSSISVIREDFLDPSALSACSRADIVLACATCFDAATMQGIEVGVQMMRAGTVCLVVDKQLECPGVCLVGSLVMRTSWGHANVYAYQVQQPDLGEL